MVRLDYFIKQGYTYNKPLLNSRGEWKSSTLRLKRKAHTCMRLSSTVSVLLFFTSIPYSFVRTYTHRFLPCFTLTSRHMLKHILWWNRMAEHTIHLFN